jgi:hypothetical protein
MAGSTWYRGRQFPYVECVECHCLYCDPMAEEKALAAMYGVDYVAQFSHDPENKLFGRALIHDWRSKSLLLGLLVQGRAPTV